MKTKEIGGIQKDTSQPTAIPVFWRGRKSLTVPFTALKTGIMGRHSKRERLRERAKFATYEKLKNLISADMLKYSSMSHEQRHHIKKGFYILQDRKCAICEIELTNIRKAHLDHCHETDKVRGLLCMACNFGLGVFKDDKNMLVKAIKYLTSKYELQELTKYEFIEYSNNQTI